MDRVRQFFTVARSLVETGTADHHGDLITAAPPLPTTVGGAGTDLPLLVATTGPRALRASGELAEGILPFLAGPRVLDEKIIPTVNHAAQDAGRPSVRVIAFVAAVVTDDVEAGRARRPNRYRSTTPSRPTDAAEGLGSAEVVITQTDLLGADTQRETIAALG